MRDTISATVMHLLFGGLHQPPAVTDRYAYFCELRILAKINATLTPSVEIPAC
jgi:hypothetical protein